MPFRRILSFSAWLLAALFVAIASTSNMAHAQTVTQVYQFGSASGDPVTPAYPAVITQGRDGNLYSTSAKGGAYATGAAYKFSPSGTESVIHSFLADQSEGYDCLSGLTLGRDGNFYGACSSYPNHNGNLYSLTPSGTRSSVHAYSGGADGAYPFSVPIQAADNNYYGVTYYGGIGGGTAYKTNASGSTYKVLYNFYSQAYDGSQPFGGLVQGKDGNFYGTLPGSGLHALGAIYKMSAAGKESVLYAPVATDGNNYLAGLIQGSDGYLYGCNNLGGQYGYGTVFKVSSKGAYTILHHFGSLGSADGVYCDVNLVQATDGNYYGVTIAGGNWGRNAKGGVIFKIDPKGSYSIAYTFDGTIGSIPASALYQNTNGLLYGVTQNGGLGTPGQGVAYSFNIGAKPFARLELTSGAAGNSIGIFGQGFLAATGVTFGGVSASFTPAGDNYMTVTVPTEGKSGSVVVNIPSGNLTSSKPFKLIPTVTSFTPSQGPVGTVVTITGTGLVQTTKVSFGGIAATSFTVNSGTQVTATVPTGAKTGKIVVTTKGGSAPSKGTFTVL
jgi:hypothetical protein